ncbi:unnamed protein product [Vicia faba]|uniref:Endonuclease/exonuclease/phosphatase domain-containing protein n=1 Tax=Vicia faba TaxID=3906 RepID=A0AAV0ZI40_VICFA|nr:unnamed protein product [Vicia faba]
MLSNNIRGSGTLAMRKELSQLIIKEAFDVFLIQETKAHVVYEKLGMELWGGSEGQGTFKGASGRSGGLLIMWREGMFSLNSSFSGEGFVGVNFIWKGYYLYVVNNYSPCFLHKKRLLWEEILACKAKFSRRSGVLRGILILLKKIGREKGS